MAHYALVQNGIVQKIHVLNNAVITDDDGVEQEELGQNFLAELHGYESSELVQCSYNGNIRGHYPGPGWTFDSANDVFISPKPFSSWILNEAFEWESPIPKPDDGKLYEWNETIQNWQVINPA